ncbi:MAG: branched-chain amino acid ABC transporter permease [Clostridiales bacterium]|nr:branched-chain amino acid ABC transporter permease [Clostridiales bacterium]
MATFMQALYEGVINGSIYAMVAMGISLVWGVMGILSFSQGEFLMIAMFISYFFVSATGLPPIASLPLCMGILFVLGLVIYKTIIYKALQGPTLSQRLITFALSMVLVNGMLLWFGGTMRTIQNTGMEGSIHVGLVTIAKNRIIPFIIAVCICIFMLWFLNKTVQGKAIRATSMDKNAAELVGINTEKSYSLAFGLSAAIAGAAGCALSYYYYCYPNVGANFQLFSFVAVVMGGFGSVEGAIVGGLIMGLVDSFTGVYFSTAFKYLGVCVVFMLILQFKPKGLFGGK